MITFSIFFTRSVIYYPFDFDFPMTVSTLSRNGIKFKIFSSLAVNASPTITWLSDEIVRLNEQVLSL